MIIVSSTPVNVNGTPALVYDSITNKVIVDAQGFEVNGLYEQITYTRPKTTTAGIQEAINSYGAGGIEVRISAGTFSVSSAIDVSSILSAVPNNGTFTIKLKGAGMGVTTIKGTSGITSLIRAICSGNVFGGLILEDLTLDCSGGSYGIDIASLNNHYFKNVRIINPSAAAVRTDACVVGRYENILLRQPSGANAIGFLIGVTATSTQLYYENCRVDGYLNGWKSNVIGTSGNSVSRLTLVNCTAESSTGDGILLLRAGSVILDNVDSEANAGHALNLADTTVNANALVSGVIITSGNYSTTTAGKYDINVDNVISIEFDLAYCASNGLKATTNIRTSTGVIITPTVSLPVQAPHTMNFLWTPDQLNFHQSWTPSGFAVTTPALPAGTGSANAVANDNLGPIRIFQEESTLTALGTHIIDPLGTDKALPTDPPEFTLDPGAKVYYATAVPTSWVWYGL